MASASAQSVATAKEFGSTAPYEESSTKEKPSWCRPDVESREICIRGVIVVPREEGFLGFEGGSGGRCRGRRDLKKKGGFLVPHRESSKEGNGAKSLN